MSSLNPFSCKIQIFKLRVKVSYFYETLKIFNEFSRENHGHGGHEHGVHRGFSRVSFHLRRCPQGVASELCKKTPIFGSWRSKLDHLTVCLCMVQGVKLGVATLDIFVNIQYIVFFALVWPSSKWLTCLDVSPSGRVVWAGDNKGYMASIDPGAPTPPVPCTGCTRPRSPTLKSRRGLFSTLLNPLFFVF